MSGRSTAVILRIDYASLSRLERFVDDFLGPSGRLSGRVKIVACELFDNLVTHGHGVLPPLVIVSLRAEPDLTLSYRFRAANLASFLRGLEEARSGTGEGGKPRFDEEAGLYRGFGLKMCVALASSIDVRRGLLWHRVSVVFS